MDTDGFIFHVKTEGVYEDIAKDVENIFDTSNYELKRPLPKGKNKKIIGLIRDKLGEKIMKAFARLRAKTCSDIIDDAIENRKAKIKKNFLKIIKIVS